MFYFYILYNEVRNKYYIDYTKDIPQRLSKHQHNGSPFTSRGQGKWKLVYQEAYNNKKDALQRERQIKRYKNRKYIEALVKEVNTGQVAQR